MKSAKNIGYGAGLTFLAALCVIGWLVPYENERNGDSSSLNSGDIAWLLTSSALVLLMTPGVSFFYGGLSPSRSVISTMMQSFSVMGVITVLWVVVGFSLAFGDDAGAFVGNPTTYAFFRNVGIKSDARFGGTIPLLLFAVFQMKFAVITPALICGSFSDRVRFDAYLLMTSLWSLCIYCPLAHWVWHPQGFIFKWGVLDFAGGTVVHMSSGCAALAGAVVMGKRQIEHQRPSNVPHVILGTALLWFGWFGFNSGSALAASETAAIAFATSTTAAATGIVAWMLLDGALGRKVSAIGSCCGAVVGLVAITPAAGFVTVGSSITIGAVAGIVCNFASSISRKSKIDDSLDVFAAHGVGGMVGMILTAVFSQNGVIGNNWIILGYHILALVVVSSWSFIGSYCIFRFIGLLLPLRVTAVKEQIGVDITQHGESVIELIEVATPQQPHTTKASLGTEFISV